MHGYDNSQNRNAPTTHRHTTGCTQLLCLVLILFFFFFLSCVPQSGNGLNARQLRPKALNELSPSVRGEHCYSTRAPGGVWYILCPTHLFFSPSNSNQTDCPRLNLFIHIFLAAVDDDRSLFLIWIVSSQILFFNQMFDMTYAPLSCIVFSWTVSFIILFGRQWLENVLSAAFLNG